MITELTSLRLSSSPNPTNLAPYIATLNRTLEHIEDLKGSGLRGEGGIKEKVRLGDGSKTASR